MTLIVNVIFPKTRHFMEDLKTLKNLIKQGTSDKVFVWVGLRGLDVVGIEQFLNIGCVICGDYGKDIQMYCDAYNIKLFSLEKVIGKRDKYTTPKVVEHFLSAEVTSYLSYLAKNKQVCVLCYQSNELLEQYCTEKNYLCFSTPIQLKTELQSKFHVNGLLSEAGIDSIPFELLTLDAGAVNIYESLVKKWGSKFVLQTSNGSSGNGTHIVSNEIEYLKAIKEAQEQNLTALKLSKFIVGPSANINACTTSVGVFYGPFSYQLIGIKDCSHNKAGYCGNDWIATQNSSVEIKQQACKIAEKFGQLLYKKGYLGIFGLDFIIDVEAAKVYVVEVNARFQGSTQVLTDIQIASNILPLSVLHVCAFLGINIDIRCVDYNKYSANVPAVYQIILDQIKAEDVEVGSAIKAGIYKHDDGRLSFDRDGYTVSQLKTGNEVLLSCGVVVPGIKAVPDSHLLKIYGVERGIYDAQTCQLNDYGRRLIRSVYSLIGN